MSAGISAATSITARIWRREIPAAAHDRPAGRHAIPDCGRTGDVQADRPAAGRLSPPAGAQRDAEPGLPRRAGALWLGDLALGLCAEDRAAVLCLFLHGADLRDRAVDGALLARRGNQTALLSGHGAGAGGA